MLKVENVTKYYGNNLAVDNLSFEVKKGEIERVTFTNEQLHKYFPDNYTSSMMKREIISILKIWMEQYWDN